MNTATFNKLLQELDIKGLETLKKKNAKYSIDEDRLHNFYVGAGISGGTPAQACWGYLTKHLVSLRDMVKQNDFSDRENFLEKCQDAINYIRFLWCIGNEENDKLYTKDSVEENPYARSWSVLLDLESDTDFIQAFLKKHGWTGTDDTLA